MLSDVNIVLRIRTFWADRFGNVLINSISAARIGCVKVFEDERFNRILSQTRTKFHLVAQIDLPLPRDKCYCSCLFHWLFASVKLPSSPTDVRSNTSSGDSLHSVFNCILHQPCNESIQIVQQSKNNLSKIIWCRTLLKPISKITSTMLPSF